MKLSEANQHQFMLVLSRLQWCLAEAALLGTTYGFGTWVTAWWCHNSDGQACSGTDMSQNI